MSPCRGAPSDQLLANDKARRNRLGKWRVPKTVIASRGAGLDASSCTPLAVHAVVRVPYFAAFHHPGELAIVWHRQYREYMFRSRGVGLRELLWSRLESLAEFTTPFHVSASSLAGASGTHDCLFAPWSKDSASFLDLEVRCDGSVGKLRDVLQRRRDQGEGCDMYLRERNNVLRFVCLQVPTPFLFGLVRGLFNIVCVGDAFGKRSLSIGQILTHCETFGRSDARSDAADVPEWSFSLRPEMFGHAAQIIRGGYYEDADEGNFAPTELDILHWLDTMSSFSVAGLARMRHVERDGRMAQRSIYKTEYMIRCLLLACHLRGDRRLETVVEQSGVLIGMEPGWIRSNGDDCLTLPLRARMCGMRFYLDCGFCLLMQGFWELLLEGGDDFIICMLADSSPRVGKDWLLAELFVITDSAIARLLEVQEALVQAFACEHVDWERVRELEAHAHHQLNKTTTTTTSNMNRQSWRNSCSTTF